MPFTNYSNFLSLHGRNFGQSLTCSGAYGVAARPNDTFNLVFTNNGKAAAPTTAVACNKATNGALNFEVPNGGANRLMVTGVNIHSAAGTYILIDRLSHQGNLVGNSATAQTTNLPTAALTRYTDGVGVMLGLSIYTIIGTTATTVSASYTNQAGTSGRTTPTVVFGGTGFREANRMILLPLASGDTGVRAVASVTLTASTLTAGAFGVTLFKPLAMVALESGSTMQTCELFTGNFIGGFPEILDDACLNLLAMPLSTTSANFGASLIFAEA